MTGSAVMCAVVVALVSAIGSAAAIASDFVRELAVFTQPELSHAEAQGTPRNLEDSDLGELCASA
jgi:hypothetical protein